MLRYSIALLFMSVFCFFAGCGKQASPSKKPGVDRHAGRIVVEVNVDGTKFWSTLPIKERGSISSRDRLAKTERETSISWSHSVNYHFVKRTGGADVYSMKWSAEHSDGSKSSGETMLEYTGKRSDMIHCNDETRILILPPSNGEESQGGSN